MGIKDQFQDKAQELSEKAKQAAQRGKSEAGERSSQAPGTREQQSQESLDDAQREAEER
ncbi:hypothetical protein [Streptomyces sp. G45]|uniref:hypothetical protein n=1 Tax=Streptomyces sp. G45 TaxID=3406627 RepID=UPI003C2612F7